MQHKNSESAKRKCHGEKSVIHVTSADHTELHNNGKRSTRDYECNNKYGRYYLRSRTNSSNTSITELIHPTTSKGHAAVHSNLGRYFRPRYTCSDDSSSSSSTDCPKTTNSHINGQNCSNYGSLFPLQGNSTNLNENLFDIQNSNLISSRSTDYHRLNFMQKSNSEVLREQPTDHNDHDTRTRYSIMHNRNVEDPLERERLVGRQRHHNRSFDQDINNEVPNQDNITTAERVLPGQPATTKAGLPKQRMAWTVEMNKNVMRCYFRSTKLETNLVRYRHEFHRQFTEIYPDLTSRLTEQRLADQRRVIVKNMRLTAQQIQKIKEETAAELQANTAQTLLSNIRSNSADQTVITTNQILSDSQETYTQTEVPTVAPAVVAPTGGINVEQQLTTELEANLMKWDGSDPTRRPPLPKLKFNRQTQQLLFTMNEILPKHLEENSDINRIHTLIYAAATSVLTCNKQELIRPFDRKSNLVRKPKWQIRLERKIYNIRKDIGRMMEYMRGNRTTKVTNRTKHFMKGDEQPHEIVDTLKQRLAVYASRLRRYKESYERRVQNKLFKDNEKIFYRNLSNKKDTEPVLPSKENITSFWRDIWSVERKHDEGAAWIKDEELRYRDLPEQQDFEITLQDLKAVIQRTHAWKTPGSDQIQNFWYKQFTSTHRYLANQMNIIMKNPQRCPEFLTEGRTYIKPKNQITQDPSNYRPITCLPTLYKIITSAITNKIDRHLTENNVLSEEQKGCRKGSQGCKEQLIIDSVIMKQVEKGQRNLTTCYVDYKKAFDSVPHTWLKKILQIYKIHPILQTFLASVMNNWRTRIHLRTKDSYILTDIIKIDKGIFQGDSLSALWFCMCLNPLSNSLNNTTCGFNIKHQKIVQHRISHLIYMDDIKIYASTQAHMSSLLRITETFTTDTKMEFGIAKCKILNIEKGRWKDSSKVETLNNQPLENMQPDETYKYLGFEQNTRIDHSETKKYIKTQYKNRLTQILRSKLNSGNIFKAINTYAIPLLAYSFGIIRWSVTDLEELNRLNRTELTKHRMHHPKSCTERVNLNRSEGGRGLLDIIALHNKQISNLRQYFHRKETTLHRAIAKADKNYTPLNLAQNIEIVSHLPNLEEKKERWAQKALHGKHYNIIQNPEIDKHLSYQWLKKGELFPETEGFLIAAQDQVLATRNYRKYILKDGTVETSTCRRCHLIQETTDHITAGCKLLAGTEYTERHNIFAKIIHHELGKKLALLEDTTPYYRYTPENILENANYKLYWDRTIRTDRTINANRPDITLVDKNKKFTYLIDVSVPSDSNVLQKEQEKLEKYSTLAIEVKQVWQQEKVMIVPLIISVTGVTSKNFVDNLKTLELPAYIHSNIQKAVVLKTCQIIRKFLNQ